MPDTPAKVSPEFRKWLDELQAVSPAYPNLALTISDEDAEAWRDYFNEGYSARDAFWEDASHEHG